jgi:hypothetical protein
VEKDYPSPPFSFKKNKNIMTARQNHGFVFEDIVSSKYAISANRGSIFDISPPDESFYGSIKTVSSGTNILCLGDASRVWNWKLSTNTVKFIVGVHTNKLLHTVYEVDVCLSNKLYGSIGAYSVKNIHDSIQMAKEPDYTKARELAATLISETKNSRGLISLNPKIDSKKQRRLQCSIKLNNILENSYSIITFDTNYASITLPGYSGKPRAEPRGLSDIPNYIYD